MWIGRGLKRKSLQGLEPGKMSSKLEKEISPKEQRTTLHGKTSEKLISRSGRKKAEEEKITVLPEKKVEKRGFEAGNL